ncbi:FecCD family ABC transporter permease [Millisia brevis]|uniref:FecCD family ABC transporter permease n=1 Tax=Millisia brevis TaxID=264148 RepID=UPI000A07001B|nr:iron chelate uptake ABC transporter family permease subunit [Millisia brevis]
MSLTVGAPGVTSDTPSPRIHPLRVLVVLLICVALLAILLLVSIAVGARPIPLPDAWDALRAGGDTTEAIVVRQLRVPRTLLAVIVGIALGVAGAVMQVITRNPLAEPGLLGVNAGASLAVVLSISLLGVSGTLGRMGFALVGAGLAAVMVTWLGMRSATEDVTRLVLAGLALSASMSAVIGVITMFDSRTFDSYRFWMVGALSSADMPTVALLVGPIAVAAVIALLLGAHFNAMALGDDIGTGLGINVRRIRLIGLVVLTVLCGCATAAVGPIGFVGLVVPHVVRLLIGVDQRMVLLMSLLVGPILVLAADILGRLLVRPGELEVGIVTAFVGAPVLLLLVLRVRTGVK